MSNYTERPVWYCCAPIAPTAVEVGDHAGRGDPVAAATNANLYRALRWWRWLRCSFPESTFVMPWAAALLAGDDDADPVQREAGLVDCEATVHVIGNVVMVGGRIGTGGRREMAAARTVADLTWLGAEPPAVVTGESFAGWWSRQGGVR